MRTGTREEWRAARLDLLAKEKELTQQRDELSRLRRELPWVRVDKEYVFEGEDGPVTLPALFSGRGQLVVYHFMYGPDWTEGCPSCSFWADSFDGIVVHLAHRDTTLVCVSRAPISELLAYRKRMGWHFTWVSSLDNDFNFDYGVSFTEDRGGEYNFRPAEGLVGETPGLSAFARDGDGAVYHTYSAYARGLDPINSAYQLLDLTAKGRDEDALEWPMAWLRRHDQY